MLLKPLQIIYQHSSQSIITKIFSFPFFHRSTLYNLFLQRTEHTVLSPCIAIDLHHYRPFRFLSFSSLFRTFFGPNSLRVTLHTILSQQTELVLLPTVIHHHHFPPLPYLTLAPHPISPHTQNTQLARSAVKSVAAGIAGAVLTNPLDVIRNEYVTSVQYIVLTMCVCTSLMKILFISSFCYYNIAWKVICILRIYYYYIFERSVHYSNNLNL